VSKRIDVAADVLGAYRMWHKKHPDQVRQMTYNFPEDIPLIGKALRIVYWSDKWEDKGGFHYEHDFDSSPPVYGEVHQDADNVTKLENTAKLLKVESVHEQMPFPILAEVCELSMDVDGEGIRTLSFKKPPLMLCTRDKKAIVILHRKPIIVRGGRMHVTERGIVN